MREFIDIADDKKNRKSIFYFKKWAIFPNTVFSIFLNYTHALPLELKSKYENLDIEKRRNIKQFSPDLFRAALHSSQNNQDKSQRILNLSSGLCSCGEYNNTSFPCLHAQWRFTQQGHISGNICIQHILSKNCD